MTLEHLQTLQIVYYSNYFCLSWSADIKQKIIYTKKERIYTQILVFVCAYDKYTIQYLHITYNIYQSKGKVKWDGLSREYYGLDRYSNMIGS